MLLRLDTRDPAPIYLQIAAAVRRALTGGEIAGGDRLPAARVLAESLGVNMHTVLRGYAELEREGLVEIRRGRGVIVRADAPSHAHLLDLLHEVAAEAQRLGVGPDEITALLSEMT